jgi:hypothetical protein
MVSARVVVAVVGAADLSKSHGTLDRDVQYPAIAAVD